MKKIFTLCGFLCIASIIKAQILTQATSPTSISSIVPGYSEVSTYNTQTFSYTQPQQSSGSGEPTTYLFTGPPLSNTTYSWYVNNVLQTGETANTFDFYFPCNVTKTVKRKIYNSCGTSRI